MISIMPNRPRTKQFRFVTALAALPASGGCSDPVDPGGDPPEVTVATISLVSEPVHAWVRGESLPAGVAVEVRDASGDPLPGIVIRAEVMEGGGVVDASLWPSDAEGGRIPMDARPGSVVEPSEDPPRGCTLARRSGRCGGLSGRDRPDHPSSHLLLTPPSGISLQVPTGAVSDPVTIAILDSACPLPPTKEPATERNLVSSESAHLPGGVSVERSLTGWRAKSILLPRTPEMAGSTVGASLGISLGRSPRLCTEVDDLDEMRG